MGRGVNAKADIINPSAQAGRNATGYKPTDTPTTTTLTGTASKGGFSVSNEVFDKLTSIQKAIDDKKAADLKAQQDAAQAAVVAAQQAAAVVPAPAPQPVYVAPTAPTDVQSIIIYWATYYGVDPAYLLNIARCESTFNPTASNGTHFGLFQFLPSTYAEYAPLAGAGPDYWDANNNAHVAAYMFSQGQAAQWECK